MYCLPAWRLLSSVALHAGLLHFLFNMLAFIPLSKSLEIRMGTLQVVMPRQSFLRVRPPHYSSVTHFFCKHAFSSIPKVESQHFQSPVVLSASSMSVVTASPSFVCTLTRTCNPRSFKRTVSIVNACLILMILS
jgi:hypothetical protein